MYPNDNKQVWENLLILTKGKNIKKNNVCFINNYYILNGNLIENIYNYYHSIKLFNYLFIYLY